MVSTSTIIAVIVTLLLSLFLPIIVWIIYGIRNKGKGVWTAWLLGAAGFFVLQMLIRIPILNALSGNSDFQKFAEKNFLMYCFILAFTAGLFEVIGRYGVAKILRKKLTYERGVAAGLGHGGIEAIIIVGLTYINNLIYIVMINTGGFDIMTEQVQNQGIDVSGLVTVKETLLHSSSGIFYLAGYERVLTMILHLALSLLVFYFVFKGKDLIGIIVCLVIHTFVDFTVVVTNGMSTEYLGNIFSQTTAYIVLYAFLTVIAIASAFIISYVKKHWTVA